ncbi:unnamed protein product [Nesidiocoris tenuis]|uniref:Uncharacterized protein n=1 Tax=Nesidiocoris tenuis TaxID=355587 RepID=A0A6H5G3D5_9HEMI|nr:unnamed protein product [Nesidiocoris tenuis]
MKLVEIFKCDFLSSTPVWNGPLWLSTPKICDIYYICHIFGIVKYIKIRSLLIRLKVLSPWINTILCYNASPPFHPLAESNPPSASAEAFHFSEVISTPTTPYFLMEIGMRIRRRIRMRILRRIRIRI